ncbi:hypothetical protein CLOM_g9367 [Closterium sp. NIES-68]|nr:hypothetical protein CLOM_g9367 [Closterium sp. NIES-68]GJP73971.1 hypothetical protein CLOP_g4632 [Closterium sp. NIES-67]
MARLNPLHALALLALLFVAGAHARTVTVGKGWFSPWSYGVASWKPPTVKTGDVLLFRWRFAAHDVWRLKDLPAYNNCTFVGGKKLTAIRTSYSYRFKVPLSAAGRTLFFACSVPSHCSVFRMKTKISISL